MKKFFKNLLIALVLVLSVTSCGWLLSLFGTNGGGGDVVFGTSTMKNSYVMKATEYQLDSICVADTLPNPDTWLGATFKDFETGEVIIKRMYIKHWGKTEITYILLGTAEPYSVTRRITE